MGVEIERKFLLKRTDFLAGLEGKHYRQGYLSLDSDRNVRVRHGGDRGYITIKGRSRGASRAEYEYEIPVADADEMLDTLATGQVVEKTRYRLPQADLTWEVDIFEGANEGLAVAEIELPSEDHEFELPDWAGEEVTGDPRYYNASLAARPFRTWPQET